MLAASAPVLALGLSFGTVGAGTAGAAGNTLFVSHSAVPSAADTSCATASFSSVQAAVNAASNGGRVYLCGTVPFAEEVVITTSITLTGDPGASLQAPANPAAYTSSGLPSQFTTDGLFVPQAIVVASGPQANATVSGLGVNGPLPGNGGCAEQEFGVLVLGGASASLVGDSVTNIEDANATLGGCQFGVAVQVGREFWPTSDFSTFDVENFVGHATIAGTTVSGYQKNGITVDGPASTASVRDDTVTGAGQTPVIGQNGIQISRGAQGDVWQSSVSANQYTGSAPASATGILVFGGCGDPLVTGVHVHNNTLTNNDIGVDVNDFDPSCSTAPSRPTGVAVHNNSVSDDVISNIGGNDGVLVPVQGYQAGIVDVGNGDNIHNNDISGIGYTPADTSASAATFRLPVDTSLATGSKVHNNDGR